VNAEGGKRDFGRWEGEKRGRYENKKVRRLETEKI
jgi:hypothetical protein